MWEYSSMLVDFPNIKSVLLPRSGSSLFELVMFIIARILPRQLKLGLRNKVVCKVEIVRFIQ